MLFSKFIQLDRIITEHFIIETNIYLDIYESISSKFISSQLNTVGISQGLL